MYDLLHNELSDKRITPRTASRVAWSASRPVPEQHDRKSTRALRMLICHFWRRRKIAKSLKIPDCGEQQRPLAARVSAQKPAH